MSVTTVPSTSGAVPGQGRARPARPLRAVSPRSTEGTVPLAPTTRPQVARDAATGRTLAAGDETETAQTAGQIKQLARAPLYRPGAAHQEGVVPDPSAMCCSVVQAAVEVLRGIRPLTQLARWLSPEVYEALSRRREVTTAGGAPVSTLQARIRRARVVRIGQSAAEATVIVQDHHRVRAAAIRVEHLRGSWRVVAFELG